MTVSSPSTVEYEAVIGLETHVQLKTRSKMFCSCEVQFGAPANFFDESMVHLHVPEGATPKDGPSAGVTMATALLSLARHQKPLRPLAMTGELTLTGEVLAVGGIREKVIAAKRIGIRELILPEPNRRDFEELPDHIRRGLVVHFAARYDDVFEVVFARN